MAYASGCGMCAPGLPHDDSIRFLAAFTCGEENPLVDRVLWGDGLRYGCFVVVSPNVFPTYLLATRLLRSPEQALAVCQRVPAAMLPPYPHIIQRGSRNVCSVPGASGRRFIQCAGATLLRNAMTDSAKISLRSPATIWAAFATLTYSACGHCLRKLWAPASLNTSERPPRTKSVGTWRWFAHACSRSR